MIGINEQFTLFVYSLFIGVYLGVSYDLLHLFVLKYGNKISNSILQIVFFLIQAIIVFNVLYQINYGVIPLYSYLLFLIGFLVYNRYANYYHANQLNKIERIILTIAEKFKRLFIFMVIDPIRDVIKLIKWIGKRLSKVGRWIKKKIPFQRLKKYMKLPFLSKWVKKLKKGKKTTPTPQQKMIN